MIEPFLGRWAEPDGSLTPEARMWIEALLAETRTLGETVEAQDARIVALEGP